MIQQGKPSFKTVLATVFPAKAYFTVIKELISITNLTMRTRLGVYIFFDMDQNLRVGACTMKLNYLGTVKNRYKLVMGNLQDGPHSMK